MKRHQLGFSATVMCCLLSACLLLLYGCSSMKVVETWNNPERTGHRYQKLMILGITHDESCRKTAENIIVDELGRNGIVAVGSHNLVEEIDRAKRDDLLTAVQTAAADAVLTIRAVSKDETPVIQPGRGGGGFGTVTDVDGKILPSARNFTQSTLRINLYDSTTKELVWSATVTTFDAKDEARLSRDLGQFFAERLRHDGLL
jgi:hypothetical protein